MFVRKKFKQAALSQLKGKWKIAAVATLVSFAFLAAFYFALVTFTQNSNYEFSGRIFETQNFAKTFSDIFFSVLPILINCFCGIIFVSYIFFCFAIYKKPQVSFYDFTEGFSQWQRTVRAWLWNYLWVLLWSFLFVIPGIVKYYSYSMMFFIVAENPNVGVCKAMRISKEITRGHKSDLFALDLSFLPWAFLASITFGAGWIFLFPYFQLTKLNAYLYLKQEAINLKKILPEDFEY